MMEWKSMGFGWHPIYDMENKKCLKPKLVGGWATPLKNMSSSVGMMKFPIYGLEAGGGWRKLAG